MSHFTVYNFHKSFHKEQGCCATIGFFDGVHKGHCFLIDNVIKAARQRNLQPIVISFEKHPRLTLTHVRYWPELLTTNEEKLHLLSKTGLAACAMLHFDIRMSTLTSYEFMRNILHEELRVKCLIVGYDHHFGSDLSAGYKEYVKYGKSMGIEVLRERPYENKELRISSSVIRRFLSGGNVDVASACLGRPYKLEGTVVEGHHAGTTLGYPTANLLPNCSEQIVPGRGVYIARAETGGLNYQAMVNIGWRPTLHNGLNQTIEAHLLDYHKGNLYGSSLTLFFLHRIRDEQRFESLDALKKQLNIDAKAVRCYFRE